ARDVCFTANTSRYQFDHRLGVVAESSEGVREALASFVVGKDAPGLVYGIAEPFERNKVAFLFTDAGSEYAGIGRELYSTHAEFRNALDKCEQIVSRSFGWSLMSVLHSEQNEVSLPHESPHWHSALFALEYALAELWRSWGIMPAAVLGRGVGEYVAACV